MEPSLKPESSVFPRVTTPVSVSGGERIATPDWMAYAHHAVIVLITLQLGLYAFWQATQWPAVTGTWWQPLFSRSGPVLLPIMFGVQLVLIACAAPLAWRERDRLRRSRPALLLSIVVAAGILTIPLAYLAHFSQVKIWKDVAFLTGYLLVPIVLLLGATAVRRFFFLVLGLGFLTGTVGLFEAVHRATVEHLSPAAFFGFWYRVYAGGQYVELLLLLGAVALYASYRGAWRQPLFAILVVAYVYAILRMRADLTRLNWIALGLILPLTLIVVIPRRALRSGLLTVLAMGLLFIVTTPILNALSTNVDISSRFTPANNVSLEFRAKESELLARKVLVRPLTGWGPGGTISPNIPQEPRRNNTSSFFDGYLGIAYKFGLIVLGLLVAAILIAFWQMRRTLLAVPPRLDAALIAGVMVYLLGVLITTPASDILFANFSPLPVGILTGIGLRLCGYRAAAVPALTRS